MQRVLIIRNVRFALFVLMTILLQLCGLATPIKASGLIIVTHEIDENGKRHSIHPHWHWHHPPIIIRPKPRPEPRPRPQPVRPLVVKQHHVQVKITGQVATTKVTQVFYNPNQRRLEGEFWLPLPEDAKLNQFKMLVNGQMQQAELLDASKARKIYEDIVRKQKDPALLEFAGQDLMKCRIFPIEPRSTQRIELTYSKVIKRQNSLFELSVPFRALRYSGDPVQNFAIDVQIAQTASSITNIYSPSHKVTITRPQNSQIATVNYKASGTRPDTDFKLYFGIQDKNQDNPLVGMDFLARFSHDRPDAKDGHFLLLGSPIKDMAPDVQVPRDIVFVLDTSGSMAKTGKLNQAKNALEFCLYNLNEQDRFELIRFSTESESLFGNLQKADQASVRKAIDFTKSLKPIGGTAIHDALNVAMKLRPLQTSAHQRPFVVIFLTDGKPTIGETNESAIVDSITRRETSQRNTRVFCFGIGTQINTRLLDKISERSNGYSQYVLPTEDIEVSVSTFFNRIKKPILTNLKLTSESKDGLRLIDFYPRNLPDLYEGDQLRILGRFEGKSEVRITLSGQTSQGEQSYTRTVTLLPHSKTRQHTGNLIPGLWAKRRIGFLLDQIRLNGENEELKSEVIRLARKYGIVTPYTAYLIVEDEARRQVPVQHRNLQQLGQAEWRQSLREKGAQFSQTVSGETAIANAKTSRRLRDTSSFKGEKMYYLKKGKSGSAPSPMVKSKAGAVDITGRKNVLQAPNEREDTAQIKNRHIAGKTFYLNNDTWVDGDCQHVKGEAKKVIFASEDYFKLIQQHPHITQWLSLGRNVRLVLNGVIYEIRS